MGMIPAARGTVRIEAHDSDGHLWWGRTFRNAYCDAGARAHARGLAGDPGAVPVSHIALSPGGPRIADCEAITGWSGPPVLDTTDWRQGLGALKATVAVSGTLTCYHATLVANLDASTVGAYIEVWLKLTQRGYTDLAASEFRVLTKGSATDYRYISMAGIEAVAGTFQSGTWKLCRIPTSAFTASGSPDWTQVRGMGVKTTANSSGGMTILWDDARVFVPYTPGRTTQTLTYEGTRKPITDATASDMTATMWATWDDVEAVGQYHYAALFSDSGERLVAIVAADFYKASGLTLTVAWSLTARGT